VVKHGHYHSASAFPLPQGTLPPACQGPSSCISTYSTRSAELIVTLVLLQVNSGKANYFCRAYRQKAGI